MCATALSGRGVHSLRACAESIRAANMLNGMRQSSPLLLRVAKLSRSSPVNASAQARSLDSHWGANFTPFTAPSMRFNPVFSFL